MARGKYRGGKATGRRTFSSQDELERENAEARNPKPRDMPESDSEEDSDAEREKSAQGVRGLIETANPNAAPRRQNMKASELKGDQDSDDEGESTSRGPRELSRREREEIEKQRAQERYWKLHEQGKTEQARKDLERLSIIKKQREEEAKKRAEALAEKESKKK
mmetsp:Transcript_30516/g.58756  ORF Transcript_30516/g.58756 Transcript_30516/m.58756 type:complete len:164 (-) Transcript_30516:332-823(-)|eukprot:CAMPEP_0114249116 /NCGR_PEP_ID=MMETSP0058-20121206/13957_1 /TAXON_ID=36894 /ORGANISM="Pyramimonas parkeae, CCMP726" /LENGTH=163 /DNA_ID=CAMNT_0001362613 /DNA_START=35 /DNA_END=526 /DNA_ORIENTATION=-